MARTRLSPDRWMLAGTALVVVLVRPMLDVLALVRYVVWSAGDHCGDGGGDGDAQFSPARQMHSLSLSAALARLCALPLTQLQNHYATAVLSLQSKHLFPQSKHEALTG